MADEGLFVKFSLEARKNPHTGEWENREYITLHVPGDKTNIPHRPVEEKDKRRFATAYEAWKRGLTDVHEGQPLKEWAAISPAEVQTLAQAHIYTVEQLAAVSDGNAQAVGPIMALRDKARRHVEQTRQAAPLEKLNARVAEQDERIRELMALLESQARPEEPARKRGRPPKARDEAEVPQDGAPADEGP
jgi:hypothetical protein